MTEAHSTPGADEHEHVKGYQVAGYIRPIAIVVFRRDRDGAILVAPGFDRVKQQRFYRPLGGGIEFMEGAEDAARREILEELGAQVEDLELLDVRENIFTYLGQPGHEIVFTFAGRFVDASLYDREVLIADESGARFEVHWVPLETFSSEDVRLYPDGLLDLLMTPIDHERYDEGAMGITYVDMQIGSVAQPDRTETVRLMVDSGALYSIIQRPILERLGISPLTQERFQLANGEVIVRHKGGALFRYGDRVGVADVVFGEPGDANLLGAHTLEALALGLNPLRRELFELVAPLMGLRA